MGVVRKISRRPVPLGNVQEERESREVRDDSPSPLTNERSDEKRNDESIEEQSNDSMEEVSKDVSSLPSPLNVNWEGWKSTISSIGTYIHLTFCRKHIGK